jgi:hypothetical protein
VKRLAGASGKGRPIPPRNYTAVLIGSILIVYILIALLFTYQYRGSSKGTLSWSGSNMGICSWIEFVQTDIQAEKGVIHAIDSLLLPQRR